MTTKKADRKTPKMTNDIELLPLPDWMMDLAFSAERIRKYARACIAHATAAKDAEIEALRADLADYMQIANAEADARIEDAERYRWLRQDAGFAGWSMPRQHVPCPDRIEGCLVAHKGGELSGASLDDAIDQARGKRV